MYDLLYEVLYHVVYCIYICVYLVFVNIPNILYCFSYMIFISVILASTFLVEGVSGFFILLCELLLLGPTYIYKNFIEPEVFWYNYNTTYFLFR